MIVQSKVVHLFYLHLSLFLTNKKGYPVLPRWMQSLIKQFISLDVQVRKVFLEEMGNRDSQNCHFQVIVEGRPRGHNFNLYQSYMDHLWQQYDTADPLKQYAKGFEDYLQVMFVCLYAWVCVFVFNARLFCSPLFSH